MDVHSLFKYSTARREGYHTLQAAIGLEMRNIVKHTEMASCGLLCGVNFGAVGLHLQLCEGPGKRSKNSPEECFLQESGSDAD